MKKYLILLFIIPLSLSNCGDDDNSEPILATLPPINVVDIGQDSQWDYLVFGEKDYYFLKANGSLPEAVLFHSTEANKDYSIFFSNNGNIDKVVVDDFIFSFKNPNGNKIDIGIVFPNGDIEILRELETEYDWDNYELNKSSNSIIEWSDVIRWTGRRVAAVPCAISIAAAASSLGVGTPIALWVCGNYLLDLSADILENEFDIHNGYTELVNVWGTQISIASCSGGDAFIVCASDLTSRAFSDWADHQEEIEKRKKDNVQLMDAALENGYGDVQITLTWNNGADLDLIIEDPYGEQIWWNHDSSYSQGKLDIDDIDGYGPENIFWPHLQAPIGVYKVYVHHYPSSPFQSNYKVLINAFGKIKTFSGTINNEELIHIANFDQNGIIATENKLINEKHGTPNK